MSSNNNIIGNMAMLPLRTKYRGPAPLLPADGIDIIDEALQYFKANVFFRTYEVKVRIKFIQLLISSYFFISNK